MSAAVVPASYVKLSTLTDGTVRVVIDIEPAGRAAAFALFDAPGVPVAVARLTNEAAVAHDRAQQAEPPADPLPPHKLPTPLSSKVAMTCGERSFLTFLQWFDPEGFGAVEASGCAEAATQYVRDYCGVASRRDIRPGTPAADRWASLRLEYETWQRGAAA